ncbi:MAG TPA: response regulator [Kofleriaceae bacterium]
MKRARALVADDNPDLRDVLSYILDRFGIDTEPVACGELLFSLAGDAPFDVIVTDVASSCAHLLHAARSAGSTCPIILMTGSRMTHEQVVALGPAVQVLRKPFSLAQLEVALLVSLVARRPACEPSWCAPVIPGSDPASVARPWS